MPKDETLSAFVQNGFTDIVSPYEEKSEKKNIEMMNNDLKLCLSEGLPEKTWRRFDNGFDLFAAVKLDAEMAAEREKISYADSELKIAVIGSQSRIGTTSLAILFADYFRKHKGKPIVVSMQKEKSQQLEMMCDLYEGTENNGIYTVNGIDFCNFGTPMREYPIKVLDFGNSDISILNLLEFDRVFLVGGVSWSELPMIYAAQANLTNANYTVVVNFANEAAIEEYKEFLSVNLNEVVCCPMISDVFVSDGYNDFIDSLL